MTRKLKLLLVIPNDKVYEQIKSLEIISQLGEDAVLQDENSAIETAMKNIHLNLE